MVLVDIWQLRFLGKIDYHYKVYINNKSENKASKSGNTYFPKCLKQKQKCDKSHNKNDPIVSITG